METMYIGEYVHTVDPQKRVAIPKDWRGNPQEPPLFYMVPGPERTIRVITEARFQEEVARPLERAGGAYRKGKSRAVSKLGRLIGRSYCDKQGRIVLTEPLMNYAGIADGKAVLVGLINAFEIIAPENYEAELTADEQAWIEDVLDPPAATAAEQEAEHCTNR